MSQDLIRYDLMVQDALRGVVHSILSSAARDGLPGDHHFFISFKTTASGVRLSSRLREQYPEEMTVVLQHQFWDLGVTDYAFEVGLSFGGVPERLLVPFDAITGFFDPSVQFGLKFEVIEPETAENDDRPPANAPAALPAPKNALLTSVPRTDTPAPKAEPAGGRLSAPAAAAKTPRKRTPKGAGSEPVSTPPKPGVSEAGDGAGAEVLSLDAFRKKK
jgi:hypothetical protein